MSPLTLDQLENSSEFIARHIGISPQDEKMMLSVIGETSRRALIDSIVPRSIARAKPMDLPPATTEAAALAAREMVLEEHPEKQIFVLDTLSCSGALAGAAELANKLIRIGTNFDTICIELANWAQKGHIMFALASFDNLAKAGRVSRVVGFIAGRLNMRVLGRRTEDGTIDFFFKTRGEARVLAKILEQMDEDGYDGVRPVLISECNNQNAANLLEHGIHAKWPDARVDIVPCSGLCSFYAQDQGVIITY